MRFSFKFATEEILILGIFGVTSLGLYLAACNIVNEQSNSKKQQDKSSTTDNSTINNTTSENICPPYNNEGQNNIIYPIVGPPYPSN